MMVKVLLVQIEQDVREAYTYFFPEQNAIQYH